MAARPLLCVVSFIATVLVAASVVFAADSPKEPADVGAKDRADNPAARYGDVVELVAGADVAQSMHQGLLARELARQAVLISAREELGRRTRDRALREGIAGVERTPALLLDVRVSFQDNGDAVLELFQLHGREKTSLLRATRTFAKSDTVDYAALAAWCESLSRAEIHQALRALPGPITRRAAKIVAPEPGKSDLGTTDGDRTEGATAAGPAGSAGEALSPELDRLLRRMSFASQFAAVRRLHEATADHPSNLEAAGALVRAYANLGVLCELYWTPASTVFKARSLIYARRLAVASPKSAAARYHLGYALALAGRHDAALAEFSAAESLASDKSPPAWSAIAAALCRSDVGALEQSASTSREAELARLCQTTLLEHGGVVEEDDATHITFAVDKKLPALASEMRHSWRVQAAANRHAFEAFDVATLSKNHASFSGEMYLDFAAVPSLPESVARLVRRQATEREKPDSEAMMELKSRAELTRQLRAASDQDRGEPPLGALATLIEETSFVDAYDASQMLESGYDRIESRKIQKEFRDHVLPTIERHPYKSLVEMWLAARSLDPDAMSRALRVLDESAAVPTYLDVLDMFSDMPGIESVERLHRAVAAHADDTYRDQRILVARRGDDQRRAYRKLFAVSSRSPQAIAGMIRNDWPATRARAAEWEKSHQLEPSVIAALAAQYLKGGQTSDARRCLEQYVKLSPTEWGYTNLADTYRREGDTTRWLATLEAYLRDSEEPSTHSGVNVLIARHFLAAGDYAKAQRYAESAGGESSGAGHLVAAECYEYQRQWFAAERAFRDAAEDNPYRAEALRWYRFCRRTGYGNATAAYQMARVYVENVDQDATAMALAGVGHFHLIAQQPAEALPWLEKAVRKGATQNPDGASDPYDGLHLALVAHRLGKKNLRDETLRDILVKGEKFIIRGQPRREIVELARQLQQVFAANSAEKLDRARIDDLLAATDAGQQANIAYFVGQIYDIYGDSSRSQDYLARAVAMPVPKTSRTLAAVMLRRLGVEPNDIPLKAIAPKNVVSTKK